MHYQLVILFLFDVIHWDSPKFTINNFIGNYNAFLGKVKPINTLKKQLMCFYGKIHCIY